MKASTLLFAALILALGPGSADAVVRRCIGPDGGTIYTDRPCEQFQARDADAPADADPAPSATSGSDAERPLAAYGPAWADCARTPDALLFTLRRIFEHRDINALAGLYHWSGMGGHNATVVMQHLESLLQWSSGSVDLVYPDAAFVVHAPEDWPDLPPEDPVGVRLVAPQADLDYSQPEESRMLGLVRHAGCWWLHF